MGDTTDISWAGATWNPWQGCRRKSEGCRFCYMFREMARYGKDPTDIRRSADATFQKPRKWQREVEAGKRSGRGRLVFTCSWSDWFIKEADAWRDDAWAVIRECPGLIFQILTKRPERMADHLPPFWAEIRDRCWLGASAEDQKNYDLRRPYVDADLAPVMWWSLEPLLGPIGMGLGDYTHRPAWCVVGGESGPDARPMRAQWARSIRDQCSEHGVSLHFKQWGEWIPIHRSDDDTLLIAQNGDRHEFSEVPEEWPDGQPHDGWWQVMRPYHGMFHRVGKKAAGRLLDGVTHDEFPRTEPARD